MAVDNANFPAFPPDGEPLSDFVDGFFDPFIFQPNAWVATWHQSLELALVCIFNFFTLVLIITRTTVRRRSFGRFRKDDYWLMAAALLLICPLSVSQIGANRWGEGLHNWNLPLDWPENLFRYQIGYASYYVVVSMVKISILYGFLETLPSVFRTLRIMAYMLGALIAILGLTEALLNIFQCTPFMSNFDLNVPNESCLPIEIARYAWVGISVLLDLVIVGIPFSMLRLMRLKTYERAVLLVVFGATLVGTAACAASTYAIYLNQDIFADAPFNQAHFVIANAAEILFYTLGASATMASKYFISKAETYAQRSKKSSGGGETPEASWPTSSYPFDLSTPGYDPSHDLEKSGGPLAIKQSFRTPNFNAPRSVGGHGSPESIPYSPHTDDYTASWGRPQQQRLTQHAAPMGLSDAPAITSPTRYYYPGRDRPLPPLPRQIDGSPLPPRAPSPYYSIYNDYY